LLNFFLIFFDKFAGLLVAAMVGVANNGEANMALTVISFHWLSALPVSVATTSSMAEKKLEMYASCSVVNILVIGGESRTNIDLLAI
jgi:hypothetical protein